MGGPFAGAGDVAGAAVGGGAGEVAVFVEFELAAGLWVVVGGLAGGDFAEWGDAVGEVDVVFAGGDFGDFPTGAAAWGAPGEEGVAVLDVADGADEACGVVGFEDDGVVLVGELVELAEVVAALLDEEGLFVVGCGGGFLFDGGEGFEVLFGEGAGFEEGLLFGLLA